ncbi:DUF4180 domain-containing protein [uncultured Chitinophaga sp.]|uniref:DUF4180 domain-containing protein n=1 Tax=uncultured Chitinophaga sp. TaxID=339340 RepID=UPI0025E4FC47|nr:DUF4180 domain-containing protein [uncultured Chitinophaga sp.]
MTFETHHTEIAEITSPGIVINHVEDAIDVIGNLSYQGFDKIIIHERNLLSQFFDLKTGLAGEVLQKFSNYRVRLVIVGDFSLYTSKSLKDFMYESNKGKQVNFVGNTAEALHRLQD